MLKGRNLSDLGDELRRQAKTKRDFIAPSEQVEVVVGPDHRPRVMGLASDTAFEVSQTGHEQLSSAWGIPRQYYFRMLENSPQLLVSSINNWMWKEPDTRMIRTLEGKVRAVLTPKYRTLDNIDCSLAVIPVLEELGAKIRSAEITDRRMYIQATDPKLKHQMKVGDVVEAGVCASNSEIGQGSASAWGMAYVLRCSNGMIVGQSLRKIHVGRRAKDEDAAYEVFSDKTKALDDAAFWHKLQDVVRAAFSESRFHQLVENLDRAEDEKIEGKVEKVVEVTQKFLGLSEDERAGLLTNLIEGKQYTRWGLVQSITRLGHEAGTYERCVELERSGGAVFEMSTPNFQRIASVG